MVTASQLTVPGKDRDLEAFLALPDGPTKRRPAVVVIHEIFGPDPHIQDVTHRLANEGYVALAPNLFTGEIAELLTPKAIGESMGFLRALPPEVQRDPAQIQERIRQQPAEQQRPLAAMFKIQDPARHRIFAEDLLGVARYLRARDDVAPENVGSVGFCFGGGMSALFAGTDPELAGAVIFYGNSPPSDVVAKIRCPVLGLYGAEDRRITDTVPKLAQEAEAHGVNFSFHIYAGAGHGFFNDTRTSAYQEEAARDAWHRVLEFFHSHLESRSSP
ncbi:MAG: dienelactone hydrolase family protein [Thermoplasmata archaeon]